MLIYLHSETVQCLSLLGKLLYIWRNFQQYNSAIISYQGSNNMQWEGYSTVPLHWCSGAPTRSKICQKNFNLYQ